MLKHLLAAAMTALGLTAAAAQEPATAPAPVPSESGTAPVNGLDLYYEIYGEGEPLVLLHGAYMTIPTNWNSLIPTLAADHKVIALELQGHGRTSDRDTPITYEGMADDVAGLLDHLGIQRAVVFGYSMGASVALQVAVRHPDKVTRLVVASGGIAYEAYPEGFYDMIAGVTPEMMLGTPFAEAHLSLGKTEAEFRTLAEKLLALDLDRFAWPEEEIAKIAVPTLLIFGDADVVEMEHVLKLYRLLGGHSDGDSRGLPKLQLMVLPGTSHINVFFNPANVEIMKAVVPAFLKQELPSPPQFTME